MKKKLFCAVLCAAMLVSVLLLPVGAANLAPINEETVWGRNDNCLKIGVPANNTTASHKTTLFTGTVAVDSTITFYYKPDLETATAMQSFPIVLSSGGYVNGAVAAENVMARVNMSLFTGDSVTNPGTIYYGTTLQVGEGSLSRMKIGEWNRIDLLVDLTNGTMTVYHNYNNIGSVAMANYENGYQTLVFANNGSGGRPAKYAYLDNFMIRKTCVAPAKGDLASNLSVEKVKAAADQILFFDSYDTVAASFSSYWNPVGVSQADGGILNQTEGGVLRGCQESAPADGVYNVRFVGTVEGYTAYEKIGFDVKVNGGETVRYTCRYVYNSILGSDENGISIAYTATGFGAGYLFALTVKGLSDSETYTFEVNTFTETAEGEAVCGAVSTVVYANGAIVE